MLYIVATPIGNLSEITYRAIEVLKNVEYIACEDTRTSKILLNHYEINKPLISYHKFNEKEQLNRIVEDLKKGVNIALISDAGMPCVSDPGNILVNKLIEDNLDYTVISGASALVNSFVLSGYSAPFTFMGFLPKKQGEVTKLLESYKDVTSTLIFYLSPHNISTSFEMLLKVLGDRKVCVVREISKKFEERIFTTLAQGYNGVDKGEFVLVIQAGEKTNALNNLTILQHVKHYMDSGESKNDAIKHTAVDRNMKKNDIYKVVVDKN